MTDHYSTLGVGRQSTTAEIANAYRQLLIRERQERGDQADFGAFSLAYRTLTNPSKRAEYDRFLDELSGKYVVKDAESPTEAEKCYLAGMTCMQQKNFQDAVDYLYRAVQLEPDNSHFCSQLGLSLGMFKDRLAEAERYCKKAVNLDPDNPDFRFNLGFLYQRHNLVDAAQTAFDLANEAIRSREARLLRENEPLITPWQEEGQDLLDELSRLETMFDGVGKNGEPATAAGSPTAPAAEPAAPPAEPAKTGDVPQTPPHSVAPDELVTESNLLRQLDELGSRATKAEVAEVLATTAGQAEATMDRFLDDDLLKELDLLEAQVRGVEELHNGEQEKAAIGELEAAPPIEGVSRKHEGPAAEPESEATTKPAPEPAKYTEVIPSIAQPEKAIEEARPPESVVEGITGEALREASLEAPPEEPAPLLPTGETAIKLPESLTQQDYSRITLPEALREAAETVSMAEPAEVTPPTELAPEAAMELGPVEALRAEPEVMEMPQGHRLAEGAAGDKIRMLEELEREMLGELEVIRREKERLRASA